ncbi:MAG TPA: outer membrane beta-barrel protein [Paracoccaceae bacterium]|nr:outer membrane beta-barrel protein [Paracoccaceae bacterium]
MKKLLASAAAVLIASPALAGALIFEPEPEPVVTVAPAPAPAPIANWTGPYAGVQVGWGDVEADVGTITAGGVTVSDFSSDDDDVVYGAQLGYDYDFGNGFVLGGELAYVRPEAEPTATVTGDDAVDYDAEAKIDHLVRLTARGGYSLGNTLLYVKGGGMWLDGEAEANGFTESASGWGWVAGAGIEHLITNNVSAGIEYLYHEADDFDDSGIDVNVQTVTLGINYRF